MARRRARQRAPGGERRGGVGFVEDKRPLCQLSSKRLEEKWHNWNSTARFLHRGSPEILDCEGLMYSSIFCCLSYLRFERVERIMRRLSICGKEAGRHDVMGGGEWGAEAPQVKSALCA